MRPTAPPARASAAAVAFVWSGAAVFVGSLLFFLYSYLLTYGAVTPAGPAARAIAIDTALFTAFALHHSLFARTGIKPRVAALVTPALERSVYTWSASLLFIAVCVLWLPVPGRLYQLTGPAAAAGYGVQIAGLWLTARAAARLDALDLAGVRPLLAPREPAHVPLVTTGLYGFVRHPLYFAWTLLVFGTPSMTMTRFTFAVLSTAYLAIAIPWEERALVRTFGERYRDYQRTVRWRMVPGLY